MVLNFMGLHVKKQLSYENNQENELQKRRISSG